MRNMMIWTGHMPLCIWEWWTGLTSQKKKTAIVLIISGCFESGNAIIFKLESGCIMLILLP